MENKSIKIMLVIIIFSQICISYALITDNAILLLEVRNQSCERNLWTHEWEEKFEIPDLSNCTLVPIIKDGVELTVAHYECSESSD